METARRVCLVLLVVLIVGTTVACDSSSSPPAEEAEPESSPTPSEEEPPDDEVAVYTFPTSDTDPGNVVQLWFVAGKGGPMLTTTHRDIGDTVAVGRAAMESLLLGPQGPEAETGVVSSIPEGTELLDLTIEDGLATVDLSTEFDEVGRSSTQERLALAEVVFTLTQFDTAKEVEFEIEGEPVESYGSHGIVMDDPQKRKDYEEFAPPIVVDFPFPGQQVGQTFEIEGSANVFEATVSYRAVTDKGEVVAEGFTTATCGTGCRGDYSETIKTDLTKGTYVLEVFESSAEDGSPLHKVSLPINIEV